MKNRYLISLVNWKNYHETISIIDQIGNNLPENIDVDIHVVDNNSNNESAAELGKIKDITLFNSDQNLGYAGGHEVAAKKCIEGNYAGLMILNSDIQIHNDTLNELDKSFQEFPNDILNATLVEKKGDDFGIVFLGEGPMTIVGEDKEVIYEEVAGKTTQESFGSAKYIDVTSAGGAFMFIPTSVMEEHGFMRTDFFLYAEELDYCARLKAKGVKIKTVLNAKYEHFKASSFKISEKLKMVSKYYHTRNYYLYLIDNGLRKKTTLLNEFGGTKRLLKNLWLSKMKYTFNRSISNGVKYHEALGLWHAMKNRRGRVFDPEIYSK